MGMKFVKCRKCGFLFNGENNESCPKCSTKWQEPKTTGFESIDKVKTQSETDKPQTPPERSRMFLVSVNSVNRQKISIKKDVFVIGRTAGNDIQITDEKISRKHAEIHVKESGAFLVDLNSTNCTFINNERLLPHNLYKLRDEDRVKFYNFEFIFFQK